MPKRGAEPPECSCTECFLILRAPEREHRVIPSMSTRLNEVGVPTTRTTTFGIYRSRRKRPAVSRRQPLDLG